MLEPFDMNVSGSNPGGELVGDCFITQRTPPPLARGRYKILIKLVEKPR